MSAPRSTSNAESQLKPFRTLVLSVVKHDYIALTAAAHPRFELVAVADDATQPDWVHERNQLFADQFKIPYLTDVTKAIADCAADIAIISSEAERHCALATRAAEAGLHIIVDKPMSPSLAECDSFLETIERTGVKCLVWNRNFLPALLQAREIVQNGSLGQLQAIHCDFYFSKDAGPAKGSRKPGDPPINWLERQLEAHADGSDGGVGVHPLGELQVEGIYPLAYIQMLTGAPVERVFARTATHFHQAHMDNHVDDLATVTLEMQGGVIGSLAIGRIGAASHPDIGEIKLHLVGSKGGLVISEARPEVAIYYRDQPPGEFRHERIPDEHHLLLVENFAHAIDTGEDTILDARAARDICATVVAAVESGKTARLVKVNRR